MKKNNKNNEQLYNNSLFLNNFKIIKKLFKQQNITFDFIKKNKYDILFEYQYWIEDNNFDNFIIYSENKFNHDIKNINKFINLKHNVKKKLWPIVNEILIKYFPNRTNGITSNKDSIKIFFNEQTNIKKDKEKYTYSLNIYFDKDSIDNIKPDDFVKKFDKILTKKIGYISEYDKFINKNLLNIYVNIDYDKIEKFNNILKNIIDNKYITLPKIKKISGKLNK